VIRLHHLAQINPTTPEFDRIGSASLLPFVPLEAVWPNDLDLSRRRPKGEVDSGYTRFREGDILLPKITPTFQADRTVIARGVQGGVAAGTTELHVVRVGTRADARYIRYLLSSRPFLQGGEAEMIGVAGQKRVPEEWLRQQPIHVDAIVRQRAIADFLDTETARIDALIAKKRALIDQLNERRVVLTGHAVTGEADGTNCVPSGLPWIRFIPPHWRTAKLTLVARMGSGHTPSRDHPEWWVDCTIPWITTGEVSQLREDRVEYIFETREKISALGLANSSATLHPAGTVVLSRTASPGYSAIMGSAMATSQDYVTWMCGHLLEPRFLLLCLRAMRGDLLGRLAQGSTHKTIYFPDIETIRIPLPPLDEQRHIVNQTWRQLKIIDTAVQPITQQIDLLDEHRQALITAAVTGELDVRGNAA
jgi:type I restriction enzyme, S subunit